MGIRHLSPIVWISLDIVTKVFIRGKPKCSWERREQCDNRSRDWSETATSQGALGVARSP